MDPHHQWFATFRDTDAYRRLQVRPIAYFCAEYALQSQLRTYAGGLGVLSADIIREASDQHIPFVGVGLLYDQAFEGQPEQYGLTLVVDHAYRPITVKVPVQDRHIIVGAYRWQEKSVPIYFLTTDSAENDLRDRSITEQLYPSDKERRFQQEMILGIGGLRMLEALEIHPSVYHLNEGHSAMLALELIRHEMSERSLGFQDALELSRARVAFTNHTLVASGHDVFSNDLVAANIVRYAEELSVPVQTLVRLGLIQESSLFSMTMLSLRLSARINAVSKIHARKAAEIWSDHPMSPITNGIHLPTWDCVKQDQAPFTNNSQLWALHQENKKKLLSHVHLTTGLLWPEESLVFGWARRIVGYKRPLAILSNPDRLASMVDDTHPIRFVFSGNVQPGDEEGETLLKQLVELFSQKLRGKAVMLQNYNLQLAGLLTAGCDVWLNTPVVGAEACGTSSMKAALNGVLPCSTKDGWVDEIESFGIGWILDTDAVNESFCDQLEKNMMPMYSKQMMGASRDWEQHMRHARELVINEFSCTRVLREYIEKLYLPVLK